MCKAVGPRIENHCCRDPYVLRTVYLQSSYLQHERQHDFECCDVYVTERCTPHTSRDLLGNVSDRLSLIFSAPECISFGSRH